MNEILERLKALDLGIENIIPVKGGDINDTYRIESFENSYFLKINTAQNFPQLFEKEANGLIFLADLGIFNIPKVIKYGLTDNDFQYLILEWVEKGEPTFDSWKNLGLQMAKLHQQTNANFGWEEDNYISIILQPNTFTPKWEDFYANNRILPMIKLLADKKIINSKEVVAAEKLCYDLKNIFPEEQPSIIHGDLWNGNLLPTKNGNISLIDPAIHYGHREMDIAMTDLFGGFDEEFYSTYNEVFPLAPNFNERKSIAQLFPLLVHALLFEGYYVKDVKTILKKFQF